MKITEKMLLDGYDGITNGGDWISKIENQEIQITNGGDWISKIENQEIRWNYRVKVNGEPECVCDIEKREVITLEYDRVGVIDIDAENDNHDAFKKMKSDYQKWCGIEI